MMVAGVQYVPGPRIARKLAHNTSALYQRTRLEDVLRRCPDRWWRTPELAKEMVCSTHTAAQRCTELVDRGVADERFSQGRREFRWRVPRGDA
jgi:hypothetical protein